MKSIRARIVISFGSATAILLMILAVILYFQISSTIIPLTEELSQEVIALRANEIGNQIGSYVEQVKTMADGFLGGYMVDISQMSSTQARSYTSSMQSYMTGRDMANLPEYVEYAFFSDLAGNYYTNQRERGELVGRPVYQTIVEKELPSFAGELHRSEATGKLSILVAHEIRNKSEERVGFLGTIVDVEKILQTAHNTRVADYGFGWLVDSEGRVISYPGEGMEAGLNLAEADSIGFVGMAELQEKLLSTERGFHRVTDPQSGPQLAVFASVPNTPGWKFVLSLPLGQVMERSNSLLGFTVSAFAIVILISIVVATALSGNIARPIVEIADHMNRIANGDLSTPVDLKRNDEIGRMADSFNTMRTNLQDMVGKIKEIINQASVDSHQLTATSQQNSAALEQIASTINQFTETVEGNSSQAQSMVEKAQEALALSEKGREEMQLTGDIMASISRSSDKSKSVISGLERSSGEIAQIVDLISDVAEQTNLLALNAAIEAARAGDQGRGFAVVADQVRSLAEQTQGAVENIKSIVNQLISETHSAVAVIDENNAEVEKGSQVVKRVQKDFATIAESINETVSSFNEVVLSSKELAASSREILSTTEEQTNSLVEITRSAESVSQLAEELQGLISRFSV